MPGQHFGAARSNQAMELSGHDAVSLSDRPLVDSLAIRSMQEKTAPDFVRFLLVSATGSCTETTVGTSGRIMAAFSVAMPLRPDPRNLL